jgi:hypothetical protein
MVKIYCLSNKKKYIYIHTHIHSCHTYIYTYISSLIYTKRHLYLYLETITIIHLIFIALRKNIYFLVLFFFEDLIYSNYKAKNNIIKIKLYELI